MSKYFVFVTFYFAYDAITNTNKNNKLAVLSWIIKTQSTVVAEPKGQKHFGNETRHILLNLSVILNSKKEGNDLDTHFSRHSCDGRVKFNLKAKCFGKSRITSIY